MGAVQQMLVAAQTTEQGDDEMAYIDTYTATAEATLDIPLPANARYIWLVGNAASANDNVDLLLQVTDDNFSTVKAGTSYAFAKGNVGASGVSGNGHSNGAAAVELNDSQGNVSGEQFIGKIDIYDADQSSPTAVSVFGGWLFTNGNFLQSVGSGGRYTGAEVIDGVRLSFSAGNIASASFDLFAVIST